MTKVDADTVEGMDAKATGFVSPYPSLSIELKQQNVANLKPGLAISVVGGIMLLLVTRQHVPAEFAWGWLAGLCLSSLALWLWLSQQQPAGPVVTAAGIVCGYILGSRWTPCFIVPRPTRKRSAGGRYYCCVDHRMADPVYPNRSV